MTTVLTPPPAAPAGRFGGLLRAEGHRFLARRFIRVLLAVAVVGWLAVLVISLLSFRSASPERLADARQQQQEQIQLSNEARAQCLADPTRPSDVPVAEWCGPPMTADQMPLSVFLNPAPFSLSEDGVNGAVSVAAVAAALAFLVGGTFVGAEWSSRSIVALLFWETRRPRVMGAKLLVTAATSVALGLLMQAVWLGLATLLQSVAGDGIAPPDGFWSDLLGAQGRGVLLTAFAGLLGFGLTNLLRNTGAATGVAFVYLVIVENAVRAFRPAWQPWLLTNNAAALVVPDGLTLYTPDNRLDAQGRPTYEMIEYLLTSGQAAAFLTVATAVVAGVGVVLFSRRDLH
jgi:ABC-type transport system involved in multi-copper enzyme maturation permease subunit